MGQNAALLFAPEWGTSAGGIVSFNRMPAKTKRPAKSASAGSAAPAQGSDPKRVRTRSFRAEEAESDLQTAAETEIAATSHPVAIPVQAQAAMPILAPVPRMGQNAALLFAPEWGTSAGGIVSFNMTLASNLKRALPDWVIACAVPQKNLIQKDAALKSGVVLISRDPSLPVRHYRHGTDELFDALFLPEGCHPAQVRLVVGHDHITGKHALSHRKTFCNAKYLLFQYFAPDSLIMWTETEMAQQYDIVASVGQSIYTDWRRVYQELEDRKFMYVEKITTVERQTRYQELDERKFKHVTMLPLIPDALMAVSSDPPQFNLDALQVVLCFGDTHEIAVKAYRQLCYHLGRPRSDRFRLQIAKFDLLPSGIVQTEITAGLHVHPADLLKPEQVLAAMKTAAICLMPSLEEPFGLSGMESMAIGKITLITSISGLADFLNEFDRESYEAFVVPTVSSDHLVNSHIWGYRLRDILQDADSYNRYHLKAMRLCDLLRKAQLDTSGAIYGPFKGVVAVTQASSDYEQPNGSFERELYALHPVYVRYAPVLRLIAPNLHTLRQSQWAAWVTLEIPAVIKQSLQDALGIASPLVQWLGAIDPSFIKYADALVTLGSIPEALVGLRASQWDSLTSIPIAVRRRLRGVLEHPFVGKTVKSSASLSASTDAPLLLAGVPPVDEQWIGREDSVRELLASLEPESSVVGVMGVFGMGGIGKTVLCKMLANHGDTLKRFPDGILWLTLGEQCSEQDVWANIVRLVGRVLKLTVDVIEGLLANKDEQATALRVLLRGKKVLLILDDVWLYQIALSVFHVVDLAAGSRILVSTRNEDVLTNLDATCFPVGLLSAEQSRALVWRKCEWPEATLDILAGDMQALLRKCRGLALALDTVASILQAKPQTAESIREVEQQMQSVDGIGAHLEGYAKYDSVYAAIAVSISYMRDDLFLERFAKKYFCDLALFPEDAILYVGAENCICVADLWVRHDRPDAITESEARQVMDKLSQRSLVIRHNENEFRLHDIVHLYLSAIVTNRRRDDVASRLAMSMVQRNNCENLSKLHRCVMMPILQDWFPKEVIEEHLRSEGGRWSEGERCRAWLQQQRGIVPAEQENNSKQLILLYVGDWDRVTGSIASFSLPFAVALRRAWPKVCIACVVARTHFSDTARAEAAKHDVILVSAVENAPECRAPIDDLHLALELPPGYSNSDVRMIVGHAHCTSTHVEYARNAFFQQSKCVMLHHLPTHDLEFVSPAPPMTGLIERSLRCCAVVSVGLQVYGSWSVHYDGCSVPHLKLLPAVADATVTQALVVRHLQSAEIKRLVSFARSDERSFAFVGPMFAKLCKYLPKPTNQFSIQLYCTGDSFMKTIDTQDRALIGSIIPATGPLDVSSAAVCLCTTLDGCFPIAAWEALLMGKIVLISSQTGIASLLHALYPDAYDDFVVKTIAATDDGSVTENVRVWADKLRDLFSPADQYERYQKKANQLAMQLRASVTTGELFQEFQSALEQLYKTAFVSEVTQEAMAAP
eukprot:TRINITY_DN4820_c0_g1_i2.p1 TRINITY_DN4820_c0_g1~~TRINITY_DN4820_c0_g1_i2.p1  ORF type:complete len:1594 (-),score=259.88 TRINITY_DN4820_c0_g1_i2:660-5192(-)